LLRRAFCGGGAVAGGLNCYFGCMGGFSECSPSLDCHFLSRGVRRIELVRPRGRPAARPLPCS
jgi:hypothetical protein